MADESPQYGRSSSALRALYETLTFEKSSYGQRSVKKTSQHKTASDKLVWFAPVPSPLLSPGRDKNLQASKKKPRQKSIFSIQTRGKGTIETDEPTSPKVSCIGQVRSNRKSKEGVPEYGRSRTPQHSSSKSGSASPARFFMSPGRQSKWGSLFGSRKSSSSASPSCVSYGEDNQYRDKRGVWSAAFSQNASGYPISSERSSYEFHGYDDNRSPLYSYGNISVRRGNFADENPSQSCITEMSDVRPVDKKHEEASTANRKPTYEELPSLHCDAPNNLKISVEVVPETWLWRDGEKLTVDGAPCMPERSHVSSHGELMDRTQDNDENNAATSTSSTVSDARNCRCTRDCHVEECFTSVPADSSDSANGSTCTHVSLQSESTQRDVSNSDGPCLNQMCNENRDRDCRMLRGSAVVEPQRSGLSSSTTKGFINSIFGIGKQEQHRHVKKNVDLDENMKYSGVTCKSKKAEMITKPFGALILVGYNLKDHISVKDAKDSKLTSSEELLKGTFEVGRLSFHGTGRYLQFLKGEAEFIRSRSATSHRTVIRLQRCNSEPWKPSK